MAGCVFPDVTHKAPKVRGRADSLLRNDKGTRTVLQTWLQKFLEQSYRTEMPKFCSLIRKSGVKM